MRELQYSVADPEGPNLELWRAAAPKWELLARGAVVEGAFSPLTIKAIYVLGLILASCRSVTILLGPDHETSTTFFPGYTVFASAVDLLGRCIRGNISAQGSAKDIRAGFRWLASPSSGSYAKVPLSHVLVRTQNYPYAIEDLVALRHFSAHGQAVNISSVDDFDYLVLEPFPAILGRGMKAYIDGMSNDPALTGALAVASVAPYRTRPIFEVVWSYMKSADTFSSDIEAAIGVMDWNYRSPLRHLAGGLGAG